MRVTTLRDLAQGIYPPLLESKGSGPALPSGRAFTGARDAPRLRARSVRREVEGAVYFCVLEALQNAARYAAGDLGPRPVWRQRDGVLGFEVTDDGVGFDPAAHHARVGAAWDRRPAGHGRWRAERSTRPPGSGPGSAAACRCSALDVVGPGGPAATVEV
jgi:hypothetical protein